MKQLLAKLRSLSKVRFMLTILFALTLACDVAVFYGNDTFSVFRLVIRFFKKGFRFPGILFQN